MKETKRITVKTELKEGDEGSVTAVFSTFDSVDSDGDVVRSTAFTDGQEVPMVWAHDWTDPVGKGRIQVQQDRAIFEGSFFMDTTRGQEAFRTVKNMGDLQEWSWGFRILESEFGEFEDAKVQFINRAEVFEVSPVLVGANRETATLAVKSLERTVEELKRGARNSSADLDRLRAILANVTELIGEIEEEQDSDDGKQSDEYAEKWADSLINNALSHERLSIDVT